MWGEVMFVCRYVRRSSFRNPHEYPLWSVLTTWALCTILTLSFGCEGTQPFEDDLDQDIDGKTDVYGEVDDRYDVLEMDPDHPSHRLARSIGLIIPMLPLTRRYEIPGGVQTSIDSELGIPCDDDGFCYLPFEELGEQRNLCDGVLFADQPAVTGATAFLVSPQIVITTGHTFQFTSHRNALVIFDYKIDDSNDFAVTTVRRENIYQLSRMFHREIEWDENETPSLHDNHPLADFAVLELDRRVEDRPPLQVGAGPSAVNDSLLIIGHPSGLPLKLAFGSVVYLYEDEPYFITDIDAFQGFSGAPVFHAASGIVVALHAGGAHQPDYTLDPENDCYHIEPCEEGVDREDTTGHCTGSQELRAAVFADWVPSCEGRCGSSFRFPGAGFDYCSCTEDCVDDECCHDIASVCLQDQ